VNRRQRVGNQPSFVCAGVNGPPVAKRGRARLLCGSDLCAEAQPENRIADRGVSRSIEAIDVDEQRGRHGRYDERHGSCKGTLQAKAPPSWQLTEATMVARINDGWRHGSWSSNARSEL